MPLVLNRYAAPAFVAPVSSSGAPISTRALPTATTEFDLTVRAAWAAGAPPPDPDALAASLQTVAGPPIQVATGAEVAKVVKLTWITL